MVLGIYGLVWLGGVIVAWGLRVEKLAERKLPPSDFKTDIFEDVVGEAKRGIERGWRILMAGIIIEVVAAFGISIISGLEVASLTLEARRAESKANDAALQVEIVRSNNVVLQQRLQPRTISIEQITNFIFLTQNMPKFPVRVGIGKINDEVFSYAMQIQSMLKQADYTTPNADTNWIEGIHQDDTAFMVPNRAVGSGLFDPKREWPNISLYVAMTQAVDRKIHSLRRTPTALLCPAWFLTQISPLLSYLFLERLGSNAIGAISRNGREQIILKFSFIRKS